jgi:hypothetical protein
MIRAHFTLPSLYDDKKKIVDRLDPPSLIITVEANLLFNAQTFGLTGVIPAT